MDPFDRDQITCTCFTGYSGDGRTCSGILALTLHILLHIHSTFALCIIDIDECAEGTAECPSHSMCVNTIGAYTCNCDGGYRKLSDMCEGNNIVSICHMQ